MPPSLLKFIVPGLATQEESIDTLAAPDSITLGCAALTPTCAILQGGYQITNKSINSLTAVFSSFF